MKKADWTPIILAVVIAAIAGLSYSLYIYYSSGSAEKGIVVCDPKDPGKCLWQDHVHALVVMSIDGKTKDLPLQKGVNCAAGVQEPAPI